MRFLELVHSYIEDLLSTDLFSNQKSSRARDVIASYCVMTAGWYL